MELLPLALVRYMQAPHPQKMEHQQHRNPVASMHSTGNSALSSGMQFACVRHPLQRKRCWPSEGHMCGTHSRGYVQVPKPPWNGAPAAQGPRCVSVQEQGCHAAQLRHQGTAPILTFLPHLPASSCPAWHWCMQVHPLPPSEAPRALAPLHSLSLFQNGSIRQRARELN